MSALYETLQNLCNQSAGGAWKGDIHALRHMSGERFPTNVGVTQQLETLQRRGLIRFYADRRSPKHVVWTVSLSTPQEPEYIDAYFDAVAFIEAIDQERQKRNVTISAMCGQLGIDKKIIYRIRTGLHEDLRASTMAALAVWSGIDPRLYIKRRT